MRHLPVLVLTVPKAQVPLAAAVRNLEPQSNVNTQGVGLVVHPCVSCVLTPGVGPEVRALQSGREVGFPPPPLPQNVAL